MSISKDEVTVVIPVLNEEKAICMVLDEVRAAGYENVLVVDGYSVDGTVKLAETRGVPIVSQNGADKTGAVKTAVDFVKTPYMLVMDGDYTYCAKDIERFLNHDGRYVQVVGVRNRAYMNWVHRAGNWMITRSFDLLLGAGLSDVCSGMYLLKTDIARELEFNSKRFRTEVEVIAQTVRHGDVTEVPVNYRPRVGKRKLSTWRNGFDILWSVFGLARSYNPIFFFSLLAALATVPGALAVGWALYSKLFLGTWEFNWLLFGSILCLFGGLGWAVATISVLLKRMERRIMRSIKKE
jgi:glycosyltransferase involved in cell wall biosynthesis